MARSLERYGQLSPVVVCRRQDRYELIDGFKRLGAVRGLAQIPRLSARLMEADERHGESRHLRTESCRGPHAGTGRSLDHPGAGAGRRLEPGGGGGAVGTAQELGVPAAGADRAVGTEGERRTARGTVDAHCGAADRAVAAGQPDGSAGSDPARGAVGRGIGRRGGPVAGMCRTPPARVSPGASSRSAVAGQGSAPRGARSAAERSRKPGMEARRDCCWMCWGAWKYGWRTRGARG